MLPNLDILKATSIRTVEAGVITARLRKFHTTRFCACPYKDSPWRPPKSLLYKIQGNEVTIFDDPMGRPTWQRNF